MVDEGLILLTNFRFPEHWRIQEWLNGTEYGDQFYLVITQIELPNIKKNIGKTLPALEPRDAKEKFHLILKGLEHRVEMAIELEQKILDFHKK